MNEPKDYKTQTESSRDGTGLPPRRTAIGSFGYGDEPEVLKVARVEASRHGHRYLGSEHIVFGLIVHGKSAAALAMERCGVTVDGANMALEQVAPRGGSICKPEDLPLTPWAHRIVGNALARLDQSIMTIPELLLVGVIQNPEGAGGRLLEILGVNLDVLSGTLLIMARSQRNRERT